MNEPLEKRKLWTIMLNTLKRPRLEETETETERLGCIRSAAKVVAVPGGAHDTVFRGQALLCVAKALAAEEVGDPLYALEDSFHQILMAHPLPALARLMPAKLQAMWSARPLIDAMGPNFADSCHRALLTTSRPEVWSSAAQLRASARLLRAAVRRTPQPTEEPSKSHKGFG
ncbi:unnamed protein product [Durusdinium trenchii]|uniref:Ubiquinone biosynthesis protein n=2 Tax=Durusdinium trenchii TaxID=1381693 RepID=A0ABP0MSA5_9DINO